MRPLQWVKNGLVFLPFVFAIDVAWSTDDLGQVTDLLFRLVLVFLAFCAMSSAVYLLNDLLDRHSDRQHPVKRNRPIASGRVGFPAALGSMVALVAAGLAVVTVMDLALGLVGLVYVVINVGYSFGAKRIVLP